MAAKLKCYECGERKEETTLVSAKIGGSYRRAPRHGQVRVCRDCTQRQVDRAAADSAYTVDTGRIRWQSAARTFGIAIPSGTRLDRMAGTVAP